MANSEDEDSDSAAPPDGGWGWLVAIALAFMFVVVTGPLLCFGLLFSDFLEQVGAGAKGVTITVSVFIAGNSFIGILCTPLMKKFSCRAVGLAGSLIFFVGCLLSSFATNFAFIIVSYGIMQGIGFGLMKPAVYSTFNAYFSKRRTTAMGISQTLVALGSMAAPLLIQSLLDEYGHRGAQLLIAAISLHATLAMVTLRDPDSRRHSSDHDLSTQLKLLNADTEKDIIRNPRGFTSSETKNGRPAICNEKVLFINPEVQKSENKTSHWIVSAFDLQLLKDLTFINMSVGVALTHCASSAFFSLQPVYLLYLGVSSARTATVIAAAAIGDIAARFTLGLVGCWLASRNRIIFWIGSCATAAGIVVFIRIETYTFLLILSIGLGFFKGCIYVAFALVFAEHFTPKLFPSAYNLFLLFNGTIALLSGPIIGIVRDTTDNFTSSFYVLTAMLIVTVILWGSEFIFNFYCDRISQYKSALK